MTFEEAKKILKKEGYELEKVGVPCSLSIAFTAYESPEICKAMQVVCSSGYSISMVSSRFDDRKARLSLELAENSAPMPGPDEEQPKEGNPALKEAASKFNDALLDEQAKKIKELTEENENWKSWHEMQNRQIALSNIAFRNEKNRLGKEIARLNKVIYKKNLKIEELKKESSEHLDGKVKYYGETVDLSQELCDKNEDIRLSKIREKNLVEISQKYMKENEELKEKLKSINMNRHNERICKKQLAEKDEVIADLGNELAATKKELEAFKESYKRRIKEDSEHFEHIQRICNAGLQKWLIESEYLEKDKPFCFPQLPDSSDEEEKKLSLFRDDSVGAVTNQKDCSPVKDTHPTEDNPEEIEMDEILEYVRKALEKGHTVSIDYDKAEEGGDQSATIVECGKDIDDVFEEIKRLCQE